MANLFVASLIILQSMDYVHMYASNLTSVSDVMVIQGLVNLYVYFIVYLYTPIGTYDKQKASKIQIENEDMQIINELYETELPEMPSEYRDENDISGTNEGEDKNVYNDEEAPEMDNANNSGELDDKSKIWEQLQKEAEDDQIDELNDSDEDQNVAHLGNDEHDPEDDSD